MVLTEIISHKVSRVSITITTAATALVIALGGFSPVGAQAAGTYDCGTYGAGDYDQTDCSDSTGTPSSTSTSISPSSRSSSANVTGTPGESSSSSTSTVTLNDFSEYSSTTGKSLTFKVGDVLHFALSGEQHTITVKSFDASNLVVTIASTPTDVAVAMGQTTNYDVNKDGTPDVAITYNSISSDGASATATFRALNAAAASTSSTNGPAAPDATGKATNSVNLWWLWLVIALIAVILIIWTIAATRRKAARNSGGTDFNGQ